MGCLEPGLEQKQFGVGRAGGGARYLTDEGLCFGSIKGQDGGGGGEEDGIDTAPSFEQSGTHAAQRAA